MSTARRPHYLLHSLSSIISFARRDSSSIVFESFANDKEQVRHLSEREKTIFFFLVTSDTLLEQIATDHDQLEQELQSKCQGL